MYNTSAQDHSITIRLACSEDLAAVRRLADRDTAPAPRGELLVALAGRQMRAAISIRGGEAVADPFHPTAELVTLLAERAAQLRGSKARGLRARLRGRRRGDRPGARRGSLSPQPAGTLRAFD